MDKWNMTLFEALEDASDKVFIFVTDRKSGMTQWSQKAVEYFALPEDYTCHIDEVWEEMVHPDDLELYRRNISKVFEGKSVYYACQFRVRNCYGEYVWVEGRGKMIRNDAGEQEMFAGILMRLDVQNHYDVLTGLPTMHMFYEYPAAKGDGIAILLGIDRFRKVIDTYGYNYGDKVLVEIARKLQQIVTLGEVLRFNGDEFLLILNEYTKLQAFELFENIRKELAALHMPDGRIMNISITAGALEYAGEIHSREEMVNRIEATFGYAKKYRGKMEFYSDKIYEEQRRNSMIKEGLKKSIAHGCAGFELYYQPLVDARGDQILGCEALLRWQDDTIGRVSPAEFIPLLEEDGSIVEVGRYVMRQSMLQQKLWKQKFGNFRVSFNVSYQQFFEPGYVDELVATAQEYEVDPADMILELTESCEVENSQDLKTIFEQIRAHGFKIALDDFGTGYASLLMLRDLTVDVIKIDHSFVRELGRMGHVTDSAIIKSVMVLCSYLNCDVVVEGVETKELDMLIRDMDATYLQGYYYSKPVCVQEFEDMVKKNRELATHENLSGDWHVSVEYLDDADGMRDGMDVLSVIYHKIVKVDLSKDRYRVVKIHGGQVEYVVGLEYSFHNLLAGYARMGYIYEEDMESYLAFIDLNWMQQQLREKKSLKLRYRRMVNDVFRWSTMEVFPMKEYDEQYPIVLVLMKDIQDEYTSIVQTLQ